MTDALIAIAGLTSAGLLFRHLAHRVARLTSKDRR
jgi:hypothetical protein